MREFSLKDTLQFPRNITHHKIDGLYLIIAPDIPTWMVLNENEFFLFNLLEKSFSIEDTLISLISEKDISERSARKIMESLLYKIEESKFYNSTKPIIMDDATHIKKNIHVFITHKCNLHCPYCYVSAGKPLKNELSVNEWKDAFLKISEVAPNSEITFSGGEPLTKEGILDILQFTKELGFTNILFTNGVLIDKNNIKYIKKSVSLIQISLDGLSSATHDKLRGEGTFDKIIKNINLIKSYSIDLDLAININPYNINEISTKLVDFIKDLAYSKLGIRLNYHLDKEGYAVNLTEDFFTIYKENREKIKKLIKTLINEGLYIPNEKTKLKQLRNCGIGLSFGIDSNGDIYPCDKLYKPYGNIKKDDLRKISKEFTKLNEMTEIKFMDECQECDLKYICNGGCRINNIIATGSYIKPSCSEDYKLELYEKLIYRF